MKRLSNRLAAAVAAAAGLAGAGQSALAGQPTDPGTQPPPSDQPATPGPGSSHSYAPSSYGAPQDTASAAPPPPAPGARLAGLLPSGMSQQQACGGFKELSQCAAALHASQNLSIPFADLKSRVAGGQKLAAAIHDLKPDADAKAEVRKAEEQARADLRAAPQG
jgi:hypothetical protein